MVRSAHQIKDLLILGGSDLREPVIDNLRQDSILPPIVGLRTFVSRYMNLGGADVITIMLVEMVAITKRRHLAVLDVMGMTVGTLREVVNRKENDILKFRRRTIIVA